MVAATLLATAALALSSGRGATPVAGLRADLDADAAMVAGAPRARTSDLPPSHAGPDASAPAMIALERPTVIATVHAKPVGGAAATGATTGGSTGTVAGGYQWPLKGQITQYFSSSHEGIDILGQSGDIVVAAHAGTVVGAGYLTSCGGLQIHVDIGGGVENWYQHLSATLVHVGDVIGRGTRIARVGSSGCATGPHLHFGVRINGTFVNPLKYLPAA